MKVIPKYFVGGVTTDVPIGYPTLTTQYQKQEKGSSSSDSGSKKTFIEQIFDPKARMLASDAAVMAQLAEEAGRLEGSPQFGAVSKPQQFAAIYSQYITRANMAQNNYEGLKEAKKHLIDSEASKEVAITTEGLMFVHKNGNASLSLIDPRQFVIGKDIPVTNAELTYIRANDPNYAFNDKLMSTLMAATSMKEIRTIIDDATKRLHTQKYENEFYVNPLEDRDEAALQALAKAHITEKDLQTMDLGTLLQVKIKDADNIKSIEHALNTIWSQLTAQQRSLLTVRAKEIGGNTTPLSIITEYLSAMRDQEHSFTLGIQNTYTSGNSEARAKRAEERKGESAASPLGKMQMSEAASFLAEYGKMGEHRFSDGSRGSIIINGNEVSVSKGKGNLGRVTLEELKTSNFAGILDMSNVTVGNTHIDMSKSNYVMVDGNKLVQAALPIDKQALANENVVKPDLEACIRLQQAWKKLKSMGITTPTAQNAGQINAVLTEFSLPVMFKSISGGQPVLAVTDYEYFGVMNGFVDGAALSDNATWNANLRLLKDNDADIILKEFKAKTKGYVGGKTSGLFGTGLFSDPAIYEGTVFILLRPDMNNAFSGSGINPTAAQREAMARREIHKELPQKEMGLDKYNANY